MVALVPVAMACVVAFGEWAIGCSRRPTIRTPAVQVSSATIIAKEGTYEFRDLRLVLRVWVDASALVQFELHDQVGATLAHSSERASTYSKWAFTVDDSRRLWFYSGDVGTFVWDGSADGAMQPLTKDSPLRSVIPESMKGYLQ